MAKVTKSVLIIIPKPHAQPHTMKKTYAKFQNDRYKTVRGVELTSGTHCDLGGSVECAARLETRRLRVQPRRSRQHSFMEIDHEIFSMVILYPPLIQEGQLSVSCKRMCTILVNCLED